MYNCLHMTFYCLKSSGVTLCLWGQKNWLWNLWIWKFLGIVLPFFSHLQLSFHWLILFHGTSLLCLLLYADCSFLSHFKNSVVLGLRRNMYSSSHHQPEHGRNYSLSGIVTFFILQNFFLRSTKNVDLERNFGAKNRSVQLLGHSIHLSCVLPFGSLYLLLLNLSPLLLRYIITKAICRRHGMRGGIIKRNCTAQLLQEHRASLSGIILNCRGKLFLSMYSTYPFPII